MHNYLKIIDTVHTLTVFPIFVHRPLSGMGRSLQRYRLRPHARYSHLNSMRESFSIAREKRTKSWRYNDVAEEPTEMLKNQ